MLNGWFQVIQDVKVLSEFMKVHGEKIAAHVLETYKPIYNLDPTATEIKVSIVLYAAKSPSGQERADCFLPKGWGSGVSSFKSQKWRGQTAGRNGYRGVTCSC